MLKNLLFSVPDLTAPEPIDNSDQVTFAIILIAVIIALIVIPIVFNAIQKAREKNNPQVDGKPIQTTNISSLIVSPNVRKQPLSMKSFMTQTGGSNLKI